MKYILQCDRFHQAHYYEYNTLKEAVHHAQASLNGDDDMPIRIKNEGRILWEMYDKIGYHGGEQRLKQLAERNNIEWIEWK